MNRMNNKLALTTFDVICIQETWYDDSVNSAELLASTNYTIYSRDRKEFWSEKMNGGGVMILVRNDHNSTSITISERTCLEWVGIRLCVANKIYYILCVYFAPHQTRSRMVDDLVQILKIIRSNGTNSHIVITSDFNTPNYVWEYDDQNAGCLINTEATLTRYERKLLKSMSDNFMNPVSTITNSNGKYIDQTYTTYIANTRIRKCNDLESFDVNSIHHYSIAIEIAFDNSSSRQTITSRNVFNTNLRKTKIDLDNMDLQQFTQ